MYLETKPDGVSGESRIGRVTFSKSGKSLRGRRYEILKSGGFKTNYFDGETSEEIWISGCKKSGRDRLYSETTEIDSDVRGEYWTEIRKLPDHKDRVSIRCFGKYRR
jgi:hypothetical protein